MSFESGKAMELDLYLPKLKLVFEAQGRQHYEWDFRWGDPSLQQV